MLDYKQHITRRNMGSKYRQSYLKFYWLQKQRWCLKEVRRLTRKIGKAGGEGYLVRKINCLLFFRNEKMARQLKVYIAFSEDQNLIASTNRQIILPIIQAPGYMTPFLGASQTPIWKYLYLETDAYFFILKIEKKFKNFT